MTKDIYEPEPIASEADKAKRTKAERDARILAAMGDHAERHAGELSSGGYTHNKRKKKMWNEDEERKAETVKLTHDGMIRESPSGQAKLYAFAEGNKWVPKSIIGYDGAKLVGLPRWFAKNEGLI